ncbi:hypothetical protein [Saccharothrix syringae]|uniref:Cip1-like core domain-containing protein n=1 Tax=Saccharothrix syringae TaxID=103733 RepID=A0A5Q0GZ94_SACSY|nr:hypothetical protein [Saccharothrix syringae]QFZ19357.1 hypothetical protein EKG83_19660 [Saccharothrix syringae]
MRKRLSSAVLAALLSVVALPVAAASGPAPQRLTTCAKADLLFCEDFQRVPTGAGTSLKWGVDTRDGSLEVERDRRGQKVLHARTEGNGRAFLKVDGFAAPGNSFYGRVRVKVAGFPTEPDWAHYTLVETTGDGPEVVRPLGGQYVPTLDRALWGVGADGGPTGDWTNWRESAPSRADRWQCVEWRMDAADNRVELWFDGAAAPDLTVSTRSHGGNQVDFLFPRFDTVKIGWQLYQPNGGSYDIWYDDIALGTKRIGC